MVDGSPRLLRALDRQLFLAPSQEETDRTFLAEDRSVWTFEFQFRDTDADVARMAGYHLTLARLHPARAVQTVIFWGRRPPPERALRVQQVTFHPRQVFRQALLAETELERWRDRAAPLGREAALELALLPLMRHALEMRPLLEAALPVTERLEPDLRGPARAAMLCLGYGELHAPADRAWAREELLHVPVVGQELFEDLIRDGLEKGRAEGELHRARAWLLEAFAARFEDPPVALREAVAKADDLEQLSRWHREVVRAPSAAAALAAVLATP